MVRLSLRILQAAFAAALVAAAGAAHADSANPHGESAELRIRFNVDGSTDWCDYGVKVTLSTKDPQPLLDNSTALQQMLGRIRGIVQAECPKVRAIGYYASNARFNVSGESTQLANWVYVPFSRGDLPAYCTGPVDPDTCRRRWQAFLRARDLFRNPRFEQMRLTRFLDTSGGGERPDLVWRNGDIVGRMTVAKMEFDTAAQALSAQMQAIEASCAGSVADKRFRELPASNAAFGGIRCTADGNNHDFGLLVQGAGNEFTVTAFTSVSPDGRIPPEFETSLLDAVEGRRYDPPPSKTFTFHVCNQSKHSLDIALYRRYAPDSADYLVAGWLKVDAGDCHTVANIPKGEMGYYGIGYKGRIETSTKGKRSKTLCVEPGAFKRIYSESFSCRKSRMRSFSIVNVENDDATVTLN